MGKKRKDAGAKFDGAAIHSPDEAIALTKSMATAGFDETVEAAFLLGIDARQADQAVRGTVSLPNGTGKDVRVAVFAEGEKAREAEEAGADLVGGTDLAAAITEGNQALDWDVTIAMPSLMAEVGKLGRVLGPRGLMPNPKAGTVTMDIGKAVTEFKGGRVEYRNDRYGNVHVAIGKVSFEEHALKVNLASVVEELTRVRPSSAKGRYIQKLTLSSTMGLGIKVDVNALDDLREVLR
ncbi:MAG: 50S ribosomal protein L1 [Actinobacteria bacterium]|nr:50S ribosomal protein L1 [Actinomycetota bacterium]MBU1494864.1 50S ribosomal protein L1 [Actinomycetota bacterium]